MPEETRKKCNLASDVENLLLDVINIRLLEQLHANPRISMAELARRAKLSAPSVKERVQRLEESGIIAGYRLDIDPRALGLPIIAYIRIRPMPGQLTKVAELAKATPDVVECHRITGEDCFLLKVYVAQISALEIILDKFLAFGQTTSSIVQSSPVPLRPLPLPKN